MKKIALLFLMSTVLIACNEENKRDEGLTMGNLMISKAEPQPGDQIEIHYRADSLATEKSPEAYVYYMTGNKNYPEDLPLTKDGDVYKADIKIPDSVTAIAFNFKTGETYDTNAKNGYVLPLYNSEGKETAGGKMSTAWFKLTTGSQFGYGIPQDSAFAVMNGAYQTDPENMEDWNMTLINLAQQSDKKQADAMLQKKLKGLKNKNKLSEDDFSDLSRIYEIEKRDASADSIRALAVENYPKGALARRAFIDKMRAAKDLDGKKDVLDDYEKNIGKAGFEKDYLLQNVADAYFKEGDFDHFKEYAEKQKDQMSLAGLYNNQAWELAQKDKDMAIADGLSKRSLKILEDVKNDPENKPTYYTERQFKEQLEGNEQMYSDTYAYILFKEGKVKEALAYQEKAIGEKANPEVNERYLQYLMANEDYGKAKTEAENFVKSNTATKNTKEFLAEAYKKTDPKATDFKTYLAALEATGKENARNELKKTMINEEAPQFTLTNLDGKKVALADLKGKTVVLDFWATWCGPCKSSFPGMQMAVDKFKNDPKVEFLFVDTWESISGEERQKSVNDFIDENKYTFNVLMDTPVEEDSSSYTVVSDYGVDGIPTKFVLGPDGRIKFKAVGYNGSTEGLADEIEMMIALTQS